VDKIRLEILGLSSAQAQGTSFALILGEESGNRRLPVIIGAFEAQAIAVEIEKIAVSRPMTHDLFKSFGEAYRFTVEEAIISELKEGIFYAVIICSDGKNKIEIDARPSDAIAIALRFDAPIYTYESILAEAGIVFTEEEAETESQSEKTPPPSKKSKQSSKSKSSKSLKDVSSEKLSEMLQEALSREDYEQAAKIRDELNKRN
jgi:bifunctional DNase/RNase